jgi:multiple sugar transport system substrate-binding protein
VYRTRYDNILEHQHLSLESIKGHIPPMWLMSKCKFLTRLSIFRLCLIIGLAVCITTTTAGLTAQSSAQKEQVTLTAILEDQGEPERWLTLLQPAMQELRARHPDMDIQLNHTTYPYEKTRAELLTAMSNQTPIDLITVDQIWLGEFAEKGLLTDLTSRTEIWGRSSDWYEMFWDGGGYNDKIYAIWAWSDIRGMWYWKDLLNEAGVDPNSLKTWDGYIASAKKLNAALEDKGIEGMHLVAASHSPDMSFYPYLWMLGSEILEWKSGHPSRGAYWYPAYNSTEGIRVLEFIKEQVDAGIKPQKTHFWGKEFLDRKFAVMLEALQHHVHLNTTEQKQDFEKKVGFLPMFPVPNQSNQTASLMGGWQMGIPATSRNKDLAWELITIMLEPKILVPYLAKHGNLPTQVPIGEGPYSPELSRSIPYYEELISMIQIGRIRPSIAMYPEIADHIRQALDEVFFASKEPEQALDEAALKSAKALGW